MRITQAEETWKNRTHHKCSRNLFIILGNCELAIYISSYIRTTYRLPTRGQSKVLICIAKNIHWNCICYCTTADEVFPGALFHASFEYSVESILRRIVPIPLLWVLGEKPNSFCYCVPKKFHGRFFCLDLTKGQLSQRLRINVVLLFKLRTWGVATKIWVKPSLPRTLCFKQKDLKTDVNATVNLTYRFIKEFSFV